ncbi:MAG: YncE family protein, partial [Nitrososphaerales archaeon]
LRVAGGSDWLAFGASTLVDTPVSYLDIGADAFDVVLPGANGRPARHTIRKTGTGAWIQATWTDRVAIGNLLDGDSFLQIINDGAGPEYLHEVYVTIPEGLTATATPTIAATNTPTTRPVQTLTPIPSATTAPTVPAPTATPTPADTAVSIAPVAPMFAPSVIPVLAPSSGCPPRPLGFLALDGPRALAGGPHGLYAALFDSSEVAGFTADTRVRTWQAESGAGRTNGLAIWDDTLIASNRDTGTITLHDALTGEQLALVVVGKLPWGVAAGDGPADRGAAYVANFGDGTLAIVDLANRQRMTVAVGPMPVTALVAGDEVFVLHLDGVLTRLDSTGRVRGQSSTGLANTRGMAYDPVRQRLYVGSEDAAVVALSLPTLAPVRQYALPGPAYAVAVNPHTGRIFTVDAQANRLFAIDSDSAAIDVLGLRDQGGDEGGQGLVIQNDRVAVSNFASNSVSFFDDAACAGRPNPAARSATGAVIAPISPPASTATTMPAPTDTPTALPRATPTSAPTSTAAAPAPLSVRAKIEIVWPHGEAGVADADLANITAYLLAGDGTQATRNLLDSVPCDWQPTVRLWSALNNQPARAVGIGQKRMVTGGGRTFPAWDFNDVDVSAARDPANKLSFYVTLDGPGGTTRTLHNVWTHAADARTLFPQQDVPVSASRLRPAAVDARIQIVWPQGNLPVEQAQRANITAYLFVAGTQQSLSPDIILGGGGAPTVRLHASLNNEPEAAPAVPGDGGLPGVPRVVTAANGVRFLAWDFNDVDVSQANDPLNRLYFWVTVDGITSYSNIWAHGADARTLFPQPDVLNSCK